MGNTRRKTSPAIDPLLARYERQFATLRAALAELGFFCKGTVLARRMRCGKAACACQTDSTRLHGPYVGWSRKVEGKPLSLHLQPAEADLYREGTAQWRRLRKLLGRMETLSLRAIERQAMINKQLRAAQDDTISQR